MYKRTEWHNVTAGSIYPGAILFHTQYKEYPKLGIVTAYVKDSNFTHDEEITTLEKAITYTKASLGGSYVSQTLTALTRCPLDEGSQDQYETCQKPFSPNYVLIVISNLVFEASNGEVSTKMIDEEVGYIFNADDFFKDGISTKRLIGTSNRTLGVFEHAEASSNAVLKESLRMAIE